MYADDAVITCTGDVQLYNTLSVLERWASSNMIAINKSKSAILKLRVDRRTPAPTYDYIRGFPVSIKIII